MAETISQFFPCGLGGTSACTMVLKCISVLLMQSPYNPYVTLTLHIVITSKKDGQVKHAAQEARRKNGKKDHQR